MSPLGSLPRVSSPSNGDCVSTSALRGLHYFVSRHRFVGLTVEFESPLPDDPIAMRAGSLGRLSNERMQQTKPGSAKHGPVFAADPRCCADAWE